MMQYGTIKAIVHVNSFSLEYFFNKLQSQEKIVKHRSVETMVTKKVDTFVSMVFLHVP